MNSSSARWEERSFNNEVVCSLSKVAEILNTFEKSAQHRLGMINSKLSHLECTMSVVECKLASSAGLS